jgi:hypothetical protein
LVFFGNYTEERFIASPLQLSTCALHILLLVTAAWWVRGRTLGPANAVAPRPWVVAAFAFVLTSTFWAQANVVDGSFQWVLVGIWCVIAAIGTVFVSTWSRSHGWGPAHRFGLAAGATVTYIWTAFLVQPEGQETATAPDLLGNIVFGLAAACLLGVAARRVSRAWTPVDGAVRLPRRR